LTGVETVWQPCHISGMAKHPKRPRDPAQLAKLIVDIATGAVQDAPESDKGTMSALGRFGGSVARVRTNCLRNGASK